MKRTLPALSALLLGAMLLPGLASAQTTSSSLDVILNTILLTLVTFAFMGVSLYLLSQRENTPR